MPANFSIGGLAVEEFSGLVPRFLGGIELLVTYASAKISPMCMRIGLLTQYLNNNLSGSGAVVKIHEYYLLPGAQSQPLIHKRYC